MYNTICVGHHYTQTNSNNVYNSVWINNFEMVTTEYMNPSITVRDRRPIGS